MSTKSSHSFPPGAGKAALLPGIWDEIMYDLDTSCGYNSSSVKLMNPFKGSLFEREGCEVLVEVRRQDPQALRGLNSAMTCAGVMPQGTG